MSKFLIIFSIISILIVSGCIGQTENTRPLDTIQLSFTQTIKYENENMTIFIKRDSSSKTAFIEFNSFGNSSQIKENKELYKFAFSFVCNEFTSLFTSDEADLEKATLEFNEMNRELIGDFSENEKVILNKNVFNGYEIKMVKSTVIDNQTKEKLSECTILGPSEKNITIKIY